MQRQVHLVIVGTGIDVDAAGLPSRLRGDVFYREPDAGAAGKAGTYSEELQPILSPALRGTRGVSRIAIGEGTFVSENLSLITGASPDGALEVASTGRMIEGDGAFQGLRGCLKSRSRVRLSPFEMKVEVSLVLGGRSAAGSRSRRLARARSSRLWRRGSHPQASW